MRDIKATVSFSLNSHYFQELTMIDVVFFHYYHFDIFILHILVHLLDQLIQIIQAHKVVNIINMTTNKHQLSSDSEKRRSISFNPFRNKIQPTDTDSDRSASEQTKMIRETGTEKDRKKRGKHTFTAMVSMLKNSIKPVGRLLAKRFRSDTPNELCCICFDSAQVKHWGVFLCDLCEEFLVENVFSQHTVSSIALVSQISELHYKSKNLL